MKKLIAMVLAAVMALGCTAALAEETAAAPATTFTSADGSFTITYALPEGTTVETAEWVDENLYMANILAPDGVYYYLAVSAPEAPAEGAEEIAPVTYNEENGYTDEFMKEMIDDLYADDYDSYDKGVKTTAYGTKLAVVRFNDEDSPSAYIFTTWEGYEIGVTIVSTDGSGFRQVTDEQVDKVVDFLSEVWMKNETQTAE